ncbi:MAG: hypothetical protein KatS3mg053_3414 [Candidatus Roseilinea sp.]|nr:MAG: hypothetical protein KatS3mg053_3414 [Candidatus Roseilinea sp.]
MGECLADMVVDGLIILELKAVDKLADAHEAQLLRSLRVTSFQVGRLLDFGPEPETRRQPFDDELKQRRRRKLPLNPGNPACADAS